jgi:tetratricopeptide (TPR) repeat protein
MAAAFSPDVQSVVVGSKKKTTVWKAPAPLALDVSRLAAWVEMASGLEMDEDGSIRQLGADAWQQRREWLEQLGGLPPADPAPRLDPILFGAEPAARGDGWKERGLWDRAEPAYAEAIRARPHNRSAWDALARLYASRGHVDRAAMTLAEAIRVMPEDLSLRRQFSAALLVSGDEAGWRGACNALLDRFGGTINPWTSNEIACAFTLGPNAIADPGLAVLLAGAAVKDAGVYNRASHVCTLGAALYRAGRFEEAIQRLEEATRLRGELESPRQWALMAMAHHRLGHGNEARRWLEKLQDRPPVADTADFWNELEVRLLRSEAEAVVLYDPMFPDNPFAR